MSFICKVVMNQFASKYKGLSKASLGLLECTNYANITYIKSVKSHYLVNGSIAHLQSTDLQSEKLIFYGLFDLYASI